MPLVSLSRHLVFLFITDLFDDSGPRTPISAPTMSTSPIHPVRRGSPLRRESLGTSSAGSTDSHYTASGKEIITWPVNPDDSHDLAADQNSITPSRLE